VTPTPWSTIPTTRPTTCRITIPPLPPEQTRRIPLPEVGHPSNNPLSPIPITELPPRAITTIIIPIPPGMLGVVPQLWHWTMDSATQTLMERPAVRRPTIIRITVTSPRPPCTPLPPMTSLASPQVTPRRLSRIHQSQFPPILISTIIPFMPDLPRPIISILRSRQ